MPIDQLDDFAEIVAGLELVLQLAEDLTNLVLDGVGTDGPLMEALEAWKELQIDEVAEVVADQRTVVVECPKR
jgi:hypothetical protein